MFLFFSVMAEFTCSQWHWNRYFDGSGCQTVFQLATAEREILKQETTESIDRSSNQVSHEAD